MLPQSWFVARSITRASTTAEFLLSDQIVSYHNRFPAKRRLRFDWKKRSQDRECLRRKRERNDYRDYCTSHPRGTILAKELGHFGVVALPAFVMTHCADLFGSSCLKTGHDYGVQKDCRKHDLIEATPPSVSDRIECVVR